MIADRWNIDEQVTIADTTDPGWSARMAAAGKPTAREYLLLLQHAAGNRIAADELQGLVDRAWLWNDGAFTSEGVDALKGAVDTWGVPPFESCTDEAPCRYCRPVAVAA